MRMHPKQPSIHAHLGIRATLDCSLIPKNDVIVYTSSLYENAYKTTSIRVLCLNRSSKLRSLFKLHVSDARSF